MQNFRNLKVWEKSHHLVLEIYRYTAQFPKEEKFGLISQIRRSAASIPANLAEGCGRNSDADFARFVQIAMGSASELEYHLILSSDLNYMTQENTETIIAQIQEIKRMLTRLTQTLRQSSK